MTDPDALLADYEAKLAETTRRAEQVRAGLAATSATAQSADGRIAVTVNASGNVVDLRLPDPELTAAVLDTIRRAQSGLADAVRTAMPAELAGSDLMAELDTQYRTAYPKPERPRRQRPKLDDDSDYGDRSLLR